MNMLPTRSPARSPVRPLARYGTALAMCAAALCFVTASPAFAKPAKPTAPAAETKPEEKADPKAEAKALVAYRSVLMQEMVPCTHSFVLHTAAPGRPEAVLAEVAVGLGETLLLLAQATMSSGDSARLQQAALTQRESEVLSWLAKGKTNRDIAEILGMSPRTVNKHLEHIFSKLGVETRSAAAAIGARVSPE